MNCSQYREDFGAYLEGLLDESLREQMETHVTECPGCQAELQAVRQLVAELSREAHWLTSSQWHPQNCRSGTPCLTPPGPGSASVEFTDAVMDRILQQQATELRRLKMRRRIRVLGISGVMAVGIAFFAMSSLWFAAPASAKTAAEVMAQGAEATPNPSTVHIVGKMRTLPNDNFSLIGDKYEFVPVEIWKQFGAMPKWKVEKPGRVAAMDGKLTIMLIRPNYVVKFPKPSPSAFDSTWLLALANVQDMVTHELRSAQARGWDLKLTHETTGAGEKKLLVTVESKSKLPPDDYCKNKWLGDDSDMRRVYRFDEETQRLEGFDAYLRKPSGDVLILGIDKIEYDKPFDAALFTLDLPKNAVFYKEPERLPDNEKYEKMTPEQAARAFFEACGKEDWAEVEKFYSPVDERFKKSFRGLKIVSLGTPFKSMSYGGWFVPYEIKLSITMPMAVSTDNPGKRCIVLGWVAQFEPKSKELAEMKRKLTEVKNVPDNEKHEKMTPKEAVQAMLNAYAKKDVDAAQRLTLDTTEEIKREMAGPPMTDFSVGEASFDKDTGFWQVPVEIRMNRKHNLALRSDNPAKRYVVDGGI